MKCMVSSLILLAVVAGAAPSRAQDRSQLRSMVLSRDGIVAAESPLAAEAGVRILENGGSAVDAAIATNAVMGVVEPMMNGIGGDLFAIVYDAKSNRLYGLNASGWAPRALTIEYLRHLGEREMPSKGVNSITVPGAVYGWQKLSARFGRKKLAEDLASAIRTAQNGFPVPEWTGTYWAEDAPRSLQGDESKKLYMPDGRAPNVGEVFRNPDLAWALQQIANDGSDAFYKGAISIKILNAIKRYGGTMTAEDLEDYSAEWAEPIATTYRDWTVYEMPPNGQGLAALEMLNIMEKFPLGQAGYSFQSPDALHVMIEAKKLAYSDLLKYIGDPRGQSLPVATLLSKHWASQRAQHIDPEHANCNAIAGDLPAGGDTTYLAVVDRDGNMVSLIQSNYASFGSGIVADGAGFVLQNRGALFSLDPQSPNALAGHKRPLHTIIPGFAQHGNIRLAFGIMGGWNQSQAHAQFISDLADYRMNIQAAMEAPRFTKATFTGCDVIMESRFPKDTLDGLAAKGHKIDLHGAFTANVGGGQAVLRDFASGVNYGASDPRKDGEAIAEMPLGSQH